MCNLIEHAKKEFELLGWNFDGEDGKTYNISRRIFRDFDGSYWTNHESRVEITFPYVPKSEYVDKPISEVLND
jgi:hypothetical protein